MAKKFPKNADFAAGFFSGSNSSSDSTVVLEKITAPVTATPDNENTEKKETATVRNLGGRPKKEGLKNVQYSLTMNPVMYERLKIIAEEYNNGNFSNLVDEAVRIYCREKNINLNEIEVDPEILKVYQEKQDKKNKKKK